MINKDTNKKQSIAGIKQEWWSALTKKEQRDYIEKYPTTGFNITAANIETAVRVITKDEKKPLKDSDTIRVYHGTDVKVMLEFITKGLTGAKKIYRKYSYENNNNPRGLFVTPDIKTAKEFGDCLIEFHSKVKDLEAPIWPGGVFTAQGQMAQYFDNDEHRNKAMQMRRLDIKKNTQYDFIKESDRPDVAHWLLLGGERQALFLGNLNPNSIRAVWLSSNPERINQPYKRFTPQQVIRMYKTGKGIPTRYGTNFKASDKEDLTKKDKYGKITLPREDIGVEQYIARLLKIYKHLDREEIIEILKKDEDSIKEDVWGDDQYSRIVKELRALKH